MNTDISRQIHLRILQAWVAVAAVVALAGPVLPANAGPVPGQGTWETTLQARDLDGNPATVEAYYDTALNITWLANANLGAGSIYDDTGVDWDWISTTTDGAMSWYHAIAWAASLNIHGISDWRLPTIIPVSDWCSGDWYSGGSCAWNVNPATGELAHMFHVTLGNLSGYDTVGSERPAGTWGVINTGPFVNLLGQNEQYPGAYWYGQEGCGGCRAWFFGTYNGSQYLTEQPRARLAWAVHDGDVGTPILPDDDGDGVSNAADLCPDTPAGAVVDAKGCSIAQLCPCSGPGGSSPGWRNHGEYVSCVANAGNNFLRDRLITEAQRDLIQSDAAQSICGKK